MTKRFLLIGCGNIGSRHLQALAKLPFKSNIDIVEPSKESQKIAKSRLSEIRNYETNHKFDWHESVKEIKDKSDLVIVSTTSVGRVEIIKQLLETGNSRFLIEKMVCQSHDEYDTLLSLMKSFDAKGWVNTSRRYFKTYQKIKTYFQDDKKIHLSVIATDSGLGSNAIHYIDLFCWLTGGYNVKLTGEFLHHKILPNKRGRNFMEFTGTIIGSTNNSSVVLTFVLNSKLSTIVNIVGNKKHVMVDEINEKYIDLINSNTTNFEYEYTSTLTSKIVSSILMHDTCLLPTIKDLYIPHKELFRIFNAHIKKVTKKESRFCPIT